MRLFCFSDTHQKALPECMPAPDAWLFGGDLYNRPGSGLTAEDVEFRRVVGAWSAAHPEPIYAVKGNHDLHDRANFFNSSIDLTDGTIRHLGDDLFVAGVGWLGKQFFDLPQEADLAGCCRRIEDEWAHLGGRRRLILLSHYPPNDRSVIPYMGESDGFFFNCIRDLIHDLKPMVVIAGHSHVHFGLVTRIENSVVVFPGRSGRLLTMDGDRVEISDLPSA